MRALLITLALVAVIGRRAEAYPQFQLSRDQTCTSCHLSPDGGGILDENGVTTIEGIAWRPGDGRWLHGVSTPSWLQLGGNIRVASGAVDHGTTDSTIYPMQIELAASAGANGFTVNVVGGLRFPDQTASAIHVLSSREHYVMWQQKPGETTGLFVRAGRLMPTFGLRLAEHIVYTQRFGGRPLYGEAYSAAVSYVQSSFEIHATGFIHDPIATEVEHGDGGALYVEKRLGERAAVGVEAKYATETDEHRTYVGATGKLYLPGPDLLFQAEGQLIRKRISAGSGDSYTQIAGYAMGTKPLAKSVFLDVGLGHFTQDTRVKGLYRDCLDANVHWFMTSHSEWLVTLRAELLDGGEGPNGGYALAQFHYRL